VVAESVITRLEPMRAPSPRLLAVTTDLTAWRAARRRARESEMRFRSSPIT
jgi:hypothetical protein